MNNLHEFMEEYRSNDIYPFHMPGHKRNDSFMQYKFLEHDITEIPGSDNLFAPSGVLKSLNEKLAQAYGASESFLHVNGSSGAIISAIIAACGDGETVLVSRNSHISLYNALILQGGVPKYVYPEVTDYGICGGVTPAAVDCALQNNKDIKAVFITSPTYEGFCSDISTIADVAHKYNVPLIVDEAHGAHFGFSPEFPQTAVRLGADVVIQSLHKTLPALGMTAVLHVNSSLIDMNKLRYANRITQSTSPSYIFMSNVDALFSKVLNEPAPHFEKYVELLNYFYNKMKYNNAISMLSTELEGKFSIHKTDLGKLIFYVNSNDISGVKISERLRTEFKVQMEADFAKHIIGMTSIADTKEGFDRLIKGIVEIDRHLIFNNISDKIKKEQNICVEMKMTPRQAYFGKKKSVLFSESIGAVSASFVKPYPPGVPIIAPGEVITKQAYDAVISLIEDGVNVIGLNNTMVDIVV